MGNNNCTCCCAHGNAQPDKQPEHTGFLKEYGRILLSAALLFSGIIMKATGRGFSQMTLLCLPGTWRHTCL